MMTHIQYLLGKLAEEASEVTQIALKCQQFGLEEIQEGRPPEESNAHRLHAELTDLDSIVDLIEEYTSRGFRTKQEAMRIKQEKVEKYLQKSQQLKQVE